MTENSVNPSKDPRSNWYHKDLEAIPESTSNLLAEYSNIRENQREHILNVRDKAYKAHPYPCLGRFRFLDLDLSSYPAYHSYVIPTLTRNVGDTEQEPIFLDLGTCLGQDIRKLIHDGVPASRVYGSDIIPEFIDNGYELFCDQDKLPRDHFLVPGDVFAAPGDSSDQLRMLDNRVDILHITAVFHLFNLESQKKIAHRCLRLMKKDTGSRVLILGAQVGNVTPQESRRSSGSTAFRHNAESWEEMWRSVVVDESKEWKDTVKKIEVKSLLNSENGVNGIKPTQNAGDNQEARGKGGKSKVLGGAEDGFRWHNFEVWIEF